MGPQWPKWRRPHALSTAVSCSMHKRIHLATRNLRLLLQKAAYQGKINKKQACDVLRAMRRNDCAIQRWAKRGQMKPLMAWGHLCTYLPTSLLLLLCFALPLACSVWPPQLTVCRIVSRGGSLVLRDNSPRGTCHMAGSRIDEMYCRERHKKPANIDKLYLKKRQNI